MLYRAFDGLGGVVHTHSLYATAWAQTCRPVPALGTTHADYFHGPVPCTRLLKPREIESAYEDNTGHVIVETFARRDPLSCPAVLVASHGPFAWGKSVPEAVHNAVVLEHVIRLAGETLRIFLVAAHAAVSVEQTLFSQTRPWRLLRADARPKKPRDASHNKPPENLNSPDSIMHIRFLRLRTQPTLKPAHNPQRPAPWLATLAGCLLAVALAGCASNSSGPHQQISRRSFGQTQDGTEVYLFDLRNSKGAEALISNYGGIVTSLRMPDRNGQFGDVVLGFDKLADYIKDSPFFGALIGRYGNRIARGKFTLDGVQYTLATNNYPNALHGGNKGFDKVVWEPTVLTGPDGASLKLTYLSKDGEEGYPGNLSVTVVYTLTEENALHIEYTATTDKDTVVNLTQHSYFNLAGRDSILDHIVMIPADKFTPVDSTLIPTGELRPVEGTPFDFRTPTAIGARINQDDEQLKFAKGYDHNWVINKPMGQFGLMARVTEPTTGRVLEVFSISPACSFTPATFSTAPSEARAAGSTSSVPAFAWNRSTSPIPRTGPSFPPWCSNQARFTTTPLFTSSRPAPRPTV